MTVFLVNSTGITFSWVSIGTDPQNEESQYSVHAEKWMSVVTVRIYIYLYTSIRHKHPLSRGQQRDIDESPWNLYIALGIFTFTWRLIIIYSTWTYWIYIFFLLYIQCCISQGISLGSFCFWFQSFKNWSRLRFN